MTYATDSDLTTRYTETAALSSALRQLALDDAEAWIDDEQYAGFAVRAHCLLACHLLAVDGALPDGGPGVIASRAAGAISTSYAVASLNPQDALFARTKYGRAFLEIRESVPHGPIVV